jgi:hypothetical protein
VSTFREKLINSIPDQLKPTARTWYDGLRRLPELPEAFLHPWRLESIKRLRTYKDIHRGKRCFIIGNGPSLNQLDLTLLKNEYTFGNDLVVEQCASDIQKMDIPRFLSWRARNWVNLDNDLQFIYTTYTGPGFSTDITGRVWESATVTYISLQLAYYMGFETVYLIGVDHNFITQGTPNTTVTSQGNDPNHFNPGYFGKGFRWQLPDLETSEIGYRMAKEAFQLDGRQVLDATLGGKLAVFPKVNFTELFK